MATLIEGDPKASFSIATTPRCREERYSIPRVAPLYSWSLRYRRWVLSKVASSTIFESLVWIDLGFDPGILGHWRTLYSLGQWPDKHIYISKPRFLPSCEYVHTIIWMHHIVTNKTYRDKARWELHKIAACRLEQILEATSHETAAVWPLASNLTSHPIKLRKTCRAQLEKSEANS